MSKLDKANEKLKLADFLLCRANAEDYLPAILNHILKAANLAVAEHFDLDSHSKVSPMLIQKQLEKSSSEQEKEFSAYFLELWKMSTRRHVNKLDIEKAHKRVKAFINWVRLEKQKQI
ncbi:hypothetical protein GF374_01815 [Candidatus Woesearchaeota archaeon]|nr:hypothetical protein [Candidatus Woesearchaeota archaeon]